ncbi:VanZ family protein [Bacillus solimangrovi]|uniref:VanZ-like domain-containing protein n=1 Tax=Bacillus solimangrovi TaxID=1305675 RepID=A0A1E5LDI9_9BACI|nr:VanZ family protein [Bacillus solimangrovi]OEH92157.1 hypothetical protein BFG57_02485 [Bacillus solimangrovi]
MKSIVIYWLPVFIGAAIIFSFSAQPYEKQDLKPTLSKYIDEEQVAKRFEDVKVYYANKEVSIEALGTTKFIEFFIRKFAHFSVFFMLCFLIFRALNVTALKLGMKSLIALLVTGIYAALDEYHQSFTENRTPLIEDVLLDCFGGIVGLIVAIMMYHIIIPKIKKNRTIT